MLHACIHTQQAVFECMYTDLHVYAHKTHEPQQV